MLVLGGKEAFRCGSGGRRLVSLGRTVQLPSSTWSIVARWHNKPVYDRESGRNPCKFEVIHVDGPRVGAKSIVAPVA